ncbi:Long-chain-fatty-acid--CoA ligase FadD15 [Streptomyces sp. enrichment culture]|uniref:AMP-dependent synthetase/ligase n=1 Tax=Streptomyces sp. enrichment culture TaxID=1795815 RepID=UPI003F559373
MTTPLPSSAPFASLTPLDEVPAPVPAEAETRRPDGVVREAYVPPLAPPVRHGSLADLPFENATAAPGAVVFGRRTGNGRWADVTAAAFAAQVRAVAKGMIAQGLEPGDRIAIMARTTYEWTLLDFAAWAAGLVTVPVHPASSASPARRILEDSGAVVLVTGTSEQAAAVGPEHGRLPGLRDVWVMEEGHVERLARLGARLPDTEVDARRGTLGPATLATLVHTSGTTGRPKGCALTHGNFLAGVDNAVELLRPALRTQDGEEPSVLLSLPLSHVFGRMAAVACVRARIRLGHAPSPRTGDLPPDLAAFKPTCLLAPPHLLEKVFDTVRARAQAAGRLTAFDRAASVAVRHGEATLARQAGRGSGPDGALRAARTFYDPLVYRRVRAALGGRIRYAICGGSPLGHRLAAFYAGAGVQILEGHGLTGTTGAVTTTPPLRPGTAGRPLPGTRVRAAADGEILVSGGQVPHGYRDPRAGRAVPAAPDGRLPTGDLGSPDDEGYLTVTGRKREPLITAGGTTVAPASPGNRPRARPLISRCLVPGDHRPCVSALITLDPYGVAHWRRVHGKHPVLPELLAEDPELRAALQRVIDETNKLVSRPGAIRRFAVLPRDLTREAGRPAPSTKLRREAVLRDFAEVVERLYA